VLSIIKVNKFLVRKKIYYYYYSISISTEDFSLFREKNDNMSYRVSSLAQQRTAIKRDLYKLNIEPQKKLFTQTKERFKIFYLFLQSIFT